MTLLYYGLFVALIVAADQITKFLTVANISLYENIPFIPGLLDLTYATDDYAVFWQRADYLDLRDPSMPNFQPEIYSLCAVGYESIMLGAFQMLKGPENKEMAATGIPKITDIVLGYSRDGFYYTRPDRNAFLESSQVAGAWDRGYLHEMGSVCLIVGDELWFYYAGYEGDQSLAGTSSTKQGTGGMVTKLRAAAIATEAGCDMVIANGKDPDNLYAILDGKAVGTRFIGGK